MFRYGSTNNRSLPVLLVVLAALGRLVPHPPNFTPVGAAGLFAGAALRGWLAWLLPLVAMAVTDPILGMVQGFRPFTRVTPFVYAAFLMNVAIGRILLRNAVHPVRVGVAAFLCSVQFFLVTNFAVWLYSTVFPPNLGGLATCYLAGLPYFGRTLGGDLVFTAVLFGLQAWAVRTTPESGLARSAEGRP